MSNYSYASRALSTVVVKGSLADMAGQGKSLAETFLNASVVIVADCSGSMDAHDSRGGKTRFEVANEELARLQESLPGKIALVAFSSTPMFCPNGQMPWMGGSTDLEGALKFVKIADVEGMRFITISDGEPNDPQGALAVAAQFKARIDTIFVGPEARPEGREFLEQLAKASGGQSMTADRVLELAEKVQTLLLEGAR